MKYFAAVALSVIGMGITGCGPGDKWVNAVNGPAGVKVSGRYVTATRSVKIHAVENGVKLDFSLTDSLPRVSGKRIEANMKKANFGKFVANTHSTWVEELGTSTSEECTGTKTHYERSFVVDKKSMEIGVTFVQDPSGEIVMNLVQLAPERVLGRLRSDLVSGQSKRCIATFKGAEATSKVVQEFLDTRQALIDMLAKESGFDGTRTGSRLSRVSSVLGQSELAGPHEPRVDENADNSNADYDSQTAQKDAEESAKNKVGTPMLDPTKRHPRRRPPLLPEKGGN